MADLNLDLSGIKPLLSQLGLGQAPAPAAPVDQRPVPPMPPPPTPAQAGFTAYSADPRNQQTIANSLTMPGTPITPPPAPPLSPGPTPAPAAPALNPYNPMASVQPLSQPASPTQPMAPAQPVAPAPPPTMAADMAAHPDQYQKPGLVGQGWKGFLKYGIPAALMSAGSGLSNMGRGNPTAGAEFLANQVAQDRGIPAANAANYDLRNIKPLKDAAALADTQSQTAQRNAAANKSQAQADNVGDDTKAKAKQVADAAKLGMTPVYDDKGALTGYAPDDKSPIAQSRAAKDQLVQAQVASTQSQKALRDAQTEVDKAKNDPNSPAFKLANQRLSVARQNAAAAGTRAQAYMGRYMQGAYNKGLNGETLVGAPIISDDNGTQAVVGSTNAGTAIKNQANAAQFNDVHGALDSIEKTGSDLVQSGGKLNSPAVIAALASPHSSTTEWLQSLDKANLTPQERAYVQSNIALHENIQGMRKSAGGGSTDSQVANLLKMAPGASTPDLDYLKGQTGQIRATAERLGKGATVASGGLTVRGQQKGGAPPPTSGGETIPAAAAAQLKEGQNHTFNNGQVWTLKGGKPVRIS